MSGEADSGHGAAEVASRGAIDAPGAAGSARGTIVLLVALALLWLWNALSLSPLWGYDGPGHAGYIETIAHDGRLPHPFEGWSTFHPPLYYVLAALVWFGAAPLGSEATQFALRAISGVSWILLGIGVAACLRHLGVRGLPATTAIVLAMLAPCSQMASAMIGNEALAAGLGALATLCVLRWHARPESVARACLFALVAGLAVATKFSGVFVAAGGLMPLVAARFDRRAWRAFACFAVVGLVVAGPVYLRNQLVAGTPLPLARDREPMKTVEASQVIREREVRDYLWLDPAVLGYPSLYRDGRVIGGEFWFNFDAVNVPGVLVASGWFDVQAARFPSSEYRPGTPLLRSAAVLVWLGLIPTLLAFAGAFVVARDAWRTRGTSAEAPLVPMALIAAIGFVGFTWTAPAMVAVKASYLLPVTAALAVFYVRALEQLPGWAARGALAVSVAAALGAALMFCDGLFFTAERFSTSELYFFVDVARSLESEHIEHALRWLLHPIAAELEPATGP